LPPVIHAHPSPNFNDRPDGTIIDTLIIHYTGMRSAEAAIAQLCLPAASVSSHYVIDEDGRILQLVDDGKRAWHAGTGKSSWHGKDIMNNVSIGIEMINPGHEFGYRPFPDCQMESLIALCHLLQTRHPLKPHHVLGHSDIAPMRKLDPGELFNWQWLAEENIGLWHGVDVAHMAVEPYVRTIAEIQADLHRYGYEVPLSGSLDDRTKAAILAFKRHFYTQQLDTDWDNAAQMMIERLQQLA